MMVVKNSEVAQLGQGAEVLYCDRSFKISKLKDFHSMHPAVIQQKYKMGQSASIN
jgi:hypothetical protein